MVKEPRLSHWCGQEILPERKTATCQPNSQSLTIHFQFPNKSVLYAVVCFGVSPYNAYRSNLVKGGQVLLKERECTNLSVAWRCLRIDGGSFSFFTITTKQSKFWMSQWICSAVVYHANPPNLYKKIRTMRGLQFIRPRNFSLTLILYQNSPTDSSLCSFFR
jgi:hypothetical protein